MAKLSGKLLASAVTPVRALGARLLKDLSAPKTGNPSGKREIKLPANRGC